MADAGGAVVTARWERVGLTEAEYDRIVSLLGREPNDLELGLYGVMWSEHCSYKSSRVHLKRLPTAGERVLMGPGENAGILDIGDGLAVAVRCESHNHPSAIEPYQGAATGVGGILRDIFTVGARPVALLDSLRFGPPAPGPGGDGAGDGTDAARAGRNRYLLAGVVRGIADYGNCTGIPTVGGEIYFDECYSENPLVNVMCVGLMEKARIVRGRAEGVGNPVFLVGNRTGRDGIHGASLLASQEFTQAAEEMRPAVQVGDPFMEKLLIEACLELMQTDAATGVNDLGAAGLTSACSETASRAGNGLEVDLSLVPRREGGMTPYEVMLSESQERMLVIARAGREAEVEAIFRKWGLDAARIGRVTDDGMLRLLENGRVVAEVPARTLTEEAPAYERPAVPPARGGAAHPLDLARVPKPRTPDECADILKRLLASPNVANKAWVYRQYDHMVRTSTAVLPGAGDAALLRVRGSRRGVALAIDGNGRFCQLDPYLGAAIAVAEAARNVACLGARPIGLTNCLNFASPERPEVMGQFSATIDGMSAACLALDTPVTGGNVSFYNETTGRGVYPTPVVGMVGLLEDMDRRVTHGFKAAGDVVVLLGGLPGAAPDQAPAGGAGPDGRRPAPGGDSPALGGDPLGLGGSEYLKVVHGLVAGVPPALDLDLEARLHRLLVAAAGAGLLRSAHDISEGGVAVALCESCFAAAPGARGVAVDLRAPGDGARLDALLFGEVQSRVVASVRAGDLAALERLAAAEGVPLTRIGITAGDAVRICAGGRAWIDVPTEELERAWSEALPRLMR